MSNLDPMALISVYAHQGVRDWQNMADDDTQTDAGHCLGHKYLANVKEKISDALQQSMSSGAPKFIPMPQIGNKGHRSKGFRWPFFALAKNKDGQKVTHFELFILYKQKECLAFRLELGHPGSKSHKYSHLQFNQKLYNRRIQARGIPPFISVSFPAFPLPSSDTMSLFFAMIVAVHGYEETQKIMKRILYHDINEYPKYSKALDASLHLDRNGS